MRKQAYFLLVCVFFSLLSTGVHAEIIKMGNCSNCGRQNIRTIVVEGKSFCDTCLRPKCSPCWACSQWRPKEGGEALYVNMFVCRGCLSKESNNQAFVNTLYIKVQQMMNRDMNLSMPVAPNLDVGSIEPGSLGVYHFYGSKYRITDGKIDIAAKQKFLSLIGTIAHEHAHAIQFRKNPSLRNKVIIEGFATWSMYHFYKLIGQESFFWEKFMPSTRNDEYSTGFKMMRDLENKKGKQFVINAVFRYREEE